MATLLASPTTLISLVYVSSAVKLLAEEDLLDILSVSRRNNTPRGITGMLLYKDGNFMQVLEGPESIVQERLAVIAKDPRHHRVIQLVARAESERQFGDWSMGFQNLNQIPAEHEMGFNPYLSASFLDDKFRTEPGAAYKLLRQFKQKMR